MPAGGRAPRRQENDMDSNKTEPDIVVDTASAKARNPGVQVAGNPDVWKLICKAELKPDGVNPGWMKSTKEMEVAEGWVIQVTTEHRAPNGVVTACAEALAFCPTRRGD